MSLKRKDPGNARDECLEKLADVGVCRLVAGQHFLCPALDCIKDIYVTPEFSARFPDAFQALALLEHIESGNCEYKITGLKGWVYTILAGSSGDKLYIGFSGGSPLRRWTKHQNGTGSVVVKEWGGLWGLDGRKGLVHLSLEDVAGCVVHLIPGTTLDENSQFERVWLSGFEDRHQRIRGADYSTVNLTPKHLEDLIEMEEKRTSACYVCHQLGHGCRTCPESKAPTNVRVATFGVDLAVEAFEDYLESEETDLESVLQARERMKSVQFEPTTKNDLQMITALYNHVSADVLAIGYLETSSDTSVMYPVPESCWRYQFEETKMTRAWQQLFFEQVALSVKGKSDHDTIFLKTGTSGGKSHSLITAAVDTCVNTKLGSALIFLPQRNLAEDMARGVLAKITSKDPAQRKIVSPSDWSRWIGDDEFISTDIMIGGDIIINSFATEEAELDELFSDGTRGDNEGIDDIEDFMEGVIKAVQHEGVYRRSVRWCLLMGSQGIESLRKLLRDDDWLNGVDIFVATVDKVYSEGFLPESHLRRLRFVGADEIDMARDSFGVTFSNLFGQLEMARGPTEIELTIAMATATSDDPVRLAEILTGRVGRVKVVKDGSVTKYVPVYTSVGSEEPLHEHWVGPDRDPPSAIQLYDIISSKLPVRGNLIVFYAGQPTLDGDTEKLLAMLDRNNFPTGVSTISFHQSKRQLYAMEALLRSLPGQENMTCSYTGDHPKEVRMVRGVTAAGKNMLATSAAKVGQSIPLTAAVFLTAVRDSHAFLQMMGRGGRDRWGLVFATCADPDNDTLTQEILRDPGAYLLGKGQPIRIPINNPPLFYKAASCFLQRFKSFYPAEHQLDWKTVFNKYMRVPTVLRMETDGIILSADTLESAYRVFLHKFTTCSGLNEMDAQVAIFRAREFESKIQITRRTKSGKREAVAEISKIDAFRHFFPDSINFSLHKPHEVYWRWQNIKVALPIDGSAVSIHDVQRIHIRCVPAEGTLLSFGMVEKKSGNSSGTSLNLGGVIARSGKRVTLQYAEWVLVFAGYQRRDLEGDFVGDMAQPARIASNGVDIAIWKKGSKYVDKIIAWCLDIPVSSTFRLKVQTQHAKDRLRLCVEKYFHVSNETFMIEMRFSELQGQIHMKLIIAETNKGKTCGLCSQMLEPAFQRSIGQILVS